MEEGGEEIGSLIRDFEWIRERLAQHIKVNFCESTPIFLYNTHNHFRQNTIAPVSEGVQGFSEAFKSRLVIPLSYSPRERAHLIAHEMTHVFQFEVLYGGAWRSPRLLKTMAGLTPLWIMEGQAEYISHQLLDLKWSAEEKMLLRDAVLYDYLYSLKELQNFTHLYRNSFLGYKIGHYAIETLSEIEGKEVNLRLLNGLRNNLDPVSAFSAATDEFTGLHDFDIVWQKKLKKEVREFVKDRESDQKIGEELSGGDFHSRNAVPDGKGGFYYVSDKWLKNEIYHRDVSSKEKKLPIPDSFELVIGHNFDRIITYAPQVNLLVFIASKDNDYYLFFYSPDSKKFSRINLEEFNAPRSPAVSYDGNNVFFTAFKDGSRNIFSYNSLNKEFTQITFDDYHDFGLFYTLEGKILSSAERDYSQDIRISDPKLKTSTWLTNSQSNDIHPSSIDGKKILYSSDKDEVFNLYTLNLSDGETRKLTNIRGGAFYPHLDSSSNIMASLYYDRSYRILSLNKTEEARVVFPPRKTSEKPALLSENLQPYTETDFQKPRFPYSSDFFLPSFLYSTDIGFVGGGYYMGSDMLNKHSLSLYFWGWPGLYEGNIQYGFKLGRADLFISGSAEEENFRVRDIWGDIYDFSENIFTSLIGLQYPISSQSALLLWGAARSNDLENKTLKKKKHESETGLGIGYSRSSVRIRPFHPVRGNSFNLSAYAARPLDSSGVSYEKYETSFTRYTPLFSDRLTLARRVSGGIFTGQDTSNFELDTKAANPLSSSYRLRGYSKKSLIGERILSGSLETRWLALEDIGWHLNFIWPDINVYSLSLKLFSDAGSAWTGSDLPKSKDDWGFSWGYGITLNLFLLQASPVILDIEFARPYDYENWRSSFLLTTGYLTW